MTKSALFLILPATLMLTCSCGSRNTSNETSTMSIEQPGGSFGYDQRFLEENGVATILLKDSANGASLLIAPGWQGRVLTSSASGDSGHSFGWINYRLIASRQATPHINAYGGEERLWLGPEGGPFSLYFKKGSKQEFANWNVPAELDTLPFEIVSKDAGRVAFRKNFTLENYSGQDLSIKIDRQIVLHNRTEAASMLGTAFPTEIPCVAYSSVNTLTNTGDQAWTTDRGMPSIWMLSMMVCSPGVTVFIPYKQGDEKMLGPVVSDNYFGKVPADRLKVKDGIIWFKADGKHRSKIGLSWARADNWAGSYDEESGTLTILWCSLPKNEKPYVNSKWGEQNNPFEGDAINSYNDGPLDDGSQMGPFYEIESSSPAAALKPLESLTHEQRIFHFEGDETKLSIITKIVFGISIEEIKASF